MILRHYSNGAIDIEFEMDTEKDDKKLGDLIGEEVFNIFSDWFKNALEDKITSLPPFLRQSILFGQTKNYALSINMFITTGVVRNILNKEPDETKKVLLNHKMKQILERITDLLEGITNINIETIKGVIEEEEGEWFEGNWDDNEDDIFKE